MKSAYLAAFSRSSLLRFRFAVLLLCGLTLSSCSIRSLAVNALANSLAASGDVFASDEDPELIREATPFALKTIESLLAEAPEHQGLLLSACQGFVQYSFAFVETDAVMQEQTDYRAAEAGHERALKLYLRAKDYCFRALELRFPGFRTRLEAEPTEVLSKIRQDDVALLYWSGAAWGAAISLGKDRPEILVDLPLVREIFDRILELDESFERGAVHEVLITLDSLPVSMGGSKDRARQHFERAVELSSGKSAGPYLSFAVKAAIPDQDLDAFRRLLDQALEVDPDSEPSYRLANLIAQRRAKFLLEHAADYFLDFEPSEEEDL
jgi:predicted anti-sigma-YlaC factor YlaD